MSSKQDYPYHPLKRKLDGESSQAFKLRSQIHRDFMNKLSMEFQDFGKYIGSVMCSMVLVNGDYVTQQAASRFASMISSGGSGSDDDDDDDDDDDNDEPATVFPVHCVDIEDPELHGPVAGRNQAIVRVVQLYNAFLDSSDKLAPETIIAVVQQFTARDAEGGGLEHCMVLVGTAQRFVYATSSLEAKFPGGFVFDETDEAPEPVGRQIARVYPDDKVNPDDWYHFCDNTFSREDQIVNGLHIAFAVYAEALHTDERLQVYTDFPPGAEVYAGNKVPEYLDIYSLTAERGGVANVVARMEDQLHFQLDHLPFCRVGLAPPGSCHGLVIVGLGSCGNALAMALACKLQCQYLPMDEPGLLPGLTAVEVYQTPTGEKALGLQLLYAKDPDRFGLGINFIVVTDTITDGARELAACRIIDALPWNTEVKLVLTLLDVRALRPQRTRAFAKYRQQIALENSDLPNFGKDLYRVVVCLD